MKKSGRTLLIIALLIIGVIIYLNKCRNAVKPPAAGGAPQPVLVSGIIVHPATINDKIFSSGTVVANEEVQLRNEIPGRVMHIYFKEGNRVDKGEMLVK